MRNQNIFLYKISWSRKRELKAHDCDQKSFDLETTTPVVETDKAFITDDGLEEKQPHFWPIF